MNSLNHQNKSILRPNIIELYSTSKTTTSDKLTLIQICKGIKLEDIIIFCTRFGNYDFVIVFIISWEKTTTTKQKKQYCNME